jgi:TrmH family RNA methyltransferase
VPGVAEPLGAKNPRLQQVRRLVSSRRTRASEGLFVVEGPTLVADALAAGLVVEVFVDEGATSVDAAVPCHRVRAGALDQIGDAVTSQGVLATARIPSTTVADLIADRPVLLLSGVADPGNAGTLVRVAEAAGCAGVVFPDGTVDPFSPKVVRSSAGSVLRVPVVAGGEAVAHLVLLAEGRGIVGTRARDAEPYRTVALDLGSVLVLGSEAHGVAPDVAALVSTWVGIPMEGTVESLNVGVAGALLAFELAARRTDS